MTRLALRLSSALALGWAGLKLRGHRDQDLADALRTYADAIDRPPPHYGVSLSTRAGKSGIRGPSAGAAAGSDLDADGAHPS